MIAILSSLPLLLVLLAPQEPVGVGARQLRSVVALDGAWEARHDPEGRGIAEGWALPVSSDGWSSVRVPCVLESHEPFAGKDGVFWMRRQFTVDRTPTDRERVRLLLDRVVESCRVWLNGVEIGSHRGGDVAFRLDTGAALLPGTNTVAVRIEDAPHPGAHGGFRVAGIAGGAAVEWVDALTVEDLLVVPVAGGDTPGRVEVRARCASTLPVAQEASLDVEILMPPASGALVSARLDFTIEAGGTAEPRVLLTIPEAKTWAPGSPNLYLAAATLLTTGVPRDERVSVLGLRSVSIRGPKFELNGSTMPVRCAVDGGYEFATFLVPGPLVPSRKKLELLAASGFNGVSVPGRLPPLDLVEAANNLGMLLFLQPSPGPDLAERIRRYRSSPSVVWWGIADGTDDDLRLVRDLDPDAIVSRDAVREGRSSYYLPGAATAVDYLRPDFHLDAPLGESANTRLRELGDRDEFAFVTASAGFAFVAPDKAIASLGGEPWREETRLLAPRAARWKTAFAEGPLREYFADPDALIESSETLHAIATQRLIEGLRANPRVGALAIRWLADDPLRPGRGLLDFVGRPKKAGTTTKLANYPRRAIAIPHRRSGEVGPRGSVDVDVGSAADSGNPIRVEWCEIGQPDGVNGVTKTVGSERAPWLVSASVGFQKGEGIYVFHPFWEELEAPDVEAVPLLGIALAQRLWERDHRPLVRPQPHVAVVGDLGNLWDDENAFLDVADALEVARAGGVTILLSALAPGEPLGELGCLPPLRIVETAGALHASSAHPAFASVAGKGLFFDSMSELVPRHAIAIPEGAEALAIAIDDHAAVLGADLLRLPLGAGSVYLGTLPLARHYFDDVAARRIAANLVGAAGEAPSGFATPKPRSDREELRTRFRAARAKRD